MKRLLTAALLLASVAAGAQTRQEIVLSDNWQFSHDKQTWQAVSVPHDWAIS